MSPKPGSALALAAIPLINRLSVLKQDTIVGKFRTTRDNKSHPRVCPNGKVTSSSGGSQCLVALLTKRIENLEKNDQFRAHAKFVFVAYEGRKINTDEEEQMRSREQEEVR